LGLPFERSRAMRKLVLRQLIFGIVFLGLACALGLTSGSKAASSTSVNIVNNSSRMIRNVYLSHVDSDDWSSNLLGNSTIGTGQSLDLSLSGCDGQQMK